MNDLRFALRMMAAHRWFSAAVIATLAVGIGLNTTVFTLANAVLFKPLPFQDGERLAVVASANRSQNIPRMNMSYPDFLDMKVQASSFEQIEASDQRPTVISEPGRPPERFRMARVTAGFFRLIRTEPIMGRGFSPEDDAPGAPRVVLIGYNVWRNRYNLDPKIVGTPVRLDETPATIIGVMAEGFGFPNREEVWIPLIPTEAGRTDRRNRSLLVLGLLKPGLSIETATSDVTAVAARLQSAHQDTNKGVEALAMRFHDRFNGGQVGTMFSLMLGAVFLVLTIVCANVANMMLSRALGRQREMAIRSALGASRWRIVRQLMVESLLLSSIGGALALVIAILGVPAFDRAVANAGKPSWILFEVDYAVLGYLALICVAAAVLFGLVPAIRTARVDLNHGLKEGGRGGSGRVGWMAATLVVLQFSMAVVLLAAAGLMMRSFLAGQNVNPWVPRAQIVTGRVELPASRYPDADARTRFFENARERLARLPGVSAVALASGMPGMGAGRRRFEIDGKVVTTPADRPSAPWVIVSPTYFEVVGLPLVRGRTFNDTEGVTGNEVVMVSRTFAERFWPGEEAVGKRLRFNEEQTPDPWMTVVAVTDALVQSQQEAAAEPVLFVPYRQANPGSLMLALRTSGDGAQLMQPFRTEMQAMDVDLPLFDVNTLETTLDNQRWPYRVFGTIFGIFAICALLLAGLGLYAVMSQATGRRTREIGIRMALGATPGRILTGVMRGGAIQLAVGLVLGIGAALGVTGQMRTLLIGVVPSDPTTLTTTSAVLVTVGLVACWIPARRAALVPPVQALASDDRAG